MKYTLITEEEKTLSELAADYEHMSSLRQTNVSIDGIPDTQIFENGVLKYNNILTDKGILLIQYPGTGNYCKYDIFDVEASLDFDSVNVKHSGIVNTIPEIETVHRLVLYKGTGNYYYADPMEVGKEESHIGETTVPQYVYRLDIDSFKATIGDSTITEVSDEDGFYRTQLVLTNIFMLGIPYKEYLYIKILNNTGTYTVEFEDTNYGAVKIKKNINYIDINKNNDTIDVLNNNYSSNYIYFKLKGTNSTPDTIMVEVY